MDTRAILVLQPRRGVWTRHSARMLPARARADRTLSCSSCKLIFDFKPGVLLCHCRALPGLRSTATAGTLWCWMTTIPRHRQRLAGAHDGRTTHGREWQVEQHAPGGST